MVGVGVLIRLRGPESRMISAQGSDITAVVLIVACQLRCPSTHRRHRDGIWATGFLIRERDTVPCFGGGVVFPLVDLARC